MTEEKAELNSAAYRECVEVLGNFRTCALDYSDPAHECTNQDGCLTCKDYAASLNRVDAALAQAEGLRGVADEA